MPGPSGVSSLEASAAQNQEEAEVVQVPDTDDLLRPVIVDGPKNYNPPSLKYNKNIEESANQNISNLNMINAMATSKTEKAEMIA
ncbi:hypothetical protein ILUMI_13456 [Ignelater luminosus]|uniref:Uncharacterized protein n=1 Tax=Ignelater luminosus TaxID=2038154 RepID=A0A8K0CW76_IGNLU|nr:hypothetical protein ILUMI_13456 [Ignelater luminosus]